MYQQSTIQTLKSQKNICLWKVTNGDYDRRSTPKMRRKTPLPKEVFPYIAELIMALAISDKNKKRISEGEYITRFNEEIMKNQNALRLIVILRNKAIDR